MQEFLEGVDLITNGTPEDKMKFLFKVYDADGENNFLKFSSGIESKQTSFFIYRERDFSKFDAQREQTKFRTIVHQILLEDICLTTLSTRGGSGGRLFYQPFTDQHGSLREEENR